VADPGLLALFVIATFLGALVAGLAGFAFGLIAAAIWLHTLTPLQAATLIVCYGLIVQGYAVWKLRHALDWRRLLPMMIGGQFGIPLGVELLRWLPAADMRAAIGVVLVVFSLYSLLRPKLRPMTDAGRLGDGIAGVASGIVGGATGLAGILPTIWASLRGWTKDEQRAVSSRSPSRSLSAACCGWAAPAASTGQPCCSSSPDCPPFWPELGQVCGSTAASTKRASARSSLFCCSWPVLLRLPR
jgi:uncharacterized membrane protein YfcA